MSAPARSRGADGGAAERTAARLDRLRGELAGRGLDALLVDTLVDVRYLTGFTGSNGVVLVRSEGESLFLTDFRYESQSAAQVSDAFTRQIVKGELADAAAASLAGRGRLGFNEDSLTVARHRRLAELAGSSWELVPEPNLVARLRLVKDAYEVDRIRAAARLADEALREVLEDGLVGRSERDVAIDLELRMRRLGAEAPSFPPIVAAGAQGARPHAEPREAEIPRDVLVVVDWGAQLDGYCSDCTRTYATGEHVPEAARAGYDVVLEAEERALRAVRAGRTNHELDAVARSYIEEAGYGERFGHGLGHGVGLDIHEAPRLSQTAPEEPVPAGSVVTIEPGVYVPEMYGVRIEDLVVVRDGGGEVLSGLPKELAVVQ